MPSISNGSTTYSFITLKGEVQPIGLMLEDITRPGVNGHAFREQALHAVPFDLLGVRDVNDLNAVATTMSAMITAYQGKIVTVVDDMGTSHANLVCLRVERVSAQKLLAAVGGVSSGKGALLVVRFTLQSTQ